VYTEARIVLRAVVTDFFFNCWYLGIRSDDSIGHVPRCVYNRAQNFRLERLRLGGMVKLGDI
jgi:hypothetical protein